MPLFRAATPPLHTTAAIPLLTLKSGIYYVVFLCRKRYITQTFKVFKFTCLSWSLD